jgi:hypothetical protein
MGKGKRLRTPQSSKKTKIFCRICGPDKKAINRQSYKDHLTNVHHDTTGNLREYGQGSLFKADHENDGRTNPVEVSLHETSDDPANRMEDDSSTEEDPGVGKFGEVLPKELSQVK